MREAEAEELNFWGREGSEVVLKNSDIFFLEERMSKREDIEKIRACE